MADESRVNEGTTDATARPDHVQAVGPIPERRAAPGGSHLYSAVVLLFLLALAFRFFDSVSRVALVAFMGVIVALALHAIIVRIPLPRGIATAVVAVVITAIVGIGTWQGLAHLVPQLQSLASDLPRIQASIEGWQAELRERTGLEVDLLGAPLESVLNNPVGAGMNVITQAFGVIEIIAIIVLVLAGALYVAAQPNEQLLDPVLRIIPQDRQPAFRRMMKRLASRLVGWLRGTLLSMLIIGTLSAIVFWAIGAPYPLLLGLVAGLLEFIPIVGPWIAAITAVLVTLFHDPTTALYVVIAAIAIQQVEGNLVYPFVMSDATSIHPFVTLLALLFFGALFGLLGALLALPLTLAIGTLVEVLWVEERLGSTTKGVEPLVEE